MTTSHTPVLSLRNRTRVHDWPASSLRYRPRCGPVENWVPIAATKTRFEFAGSTASLTLENHCSDATLAQPRLRQGAGTLSVTPTLPVTIGAAENATLSVDFAPSGAAREDVLFFDVSVGAETIRYPITLYVP